jgi:hypothetical protein
MRGGDATLWRAAPPYGGRALQSGEARRSRLRGIAVATSPGGHSLRYNSAVSLSILLPAGVTVALRTTEGRTRDR